MLKFIADVGRLISDKKSENQYEQNQTTGRGDGMVNESKQRRQLAK